MKIAYFAHDLNDEAVRRRLCMMRAGGAEVILLGFRRPDRPGTPLVGVETVELGQTYALNFVHRLALVARLSLLASRWRDRLRGVEVIVARNLDPLLLAVAVRRVCAPYARLIYECLDIHDLMVGSGMRSRAARALEGLVLRQCQSVLVSSPAFAANYFDTWQHAAAPTFLVENKLLKLTGDRSIAPAAAESPPPAAPWRIGLFGNLRCNKSLEQMIEIGRRCAGQVVFNLWGVPARHEFRDFDAQVASSPYVHYHGPYRTEALARVYGGSHFTWAIDYFQEGRNSAWLLPNRLYEGGAHDTVPIALYGVETGRWLERHGAGVLFHDVVRELPAFLEALDAAGYERLKAFSRAVPRSALIADETDCRALVEALRGDRPSQL
jgi:hypothetical protein